MQLAPPYAAFVHVHVHVHVHVRVLCMLQLPVHDMCVCVHCNTVCQCVMPGCAEGNRGPGM